MSATSRYYWDRLTAQEQAALLRVQRAQWEGLPLYVLNSLAGYGLIEWMAPVRPTMCVILTQRGASAITHWRRAS